MTEFSLSVGKIDQVRKIMDEPEITVEEYYVGMCRALFAFMDAVNFSKVEKKPRSEWDTTFKEWFNFEAREEGK